MNATTNPLYVAYMALHLANRTLDEIPFTQQPEYIRNVYALHEDIKSSMWSQLTGKEQESVRKYNKDHELAR